MALSSSFENRLSIVFPKLFSVIFILIIRTRNSSFSLYLGNPQCRASLYNKAKQQYIIDRHIVSFEAIINYYETDKLIAPTIYEPIIFFEELKYFQLPHETIQHFYKTEIYDESINHQRIVPWNSILRPIWISLEYNDYSFITQIVKSLKDK